MELSHPSLKGINTPKYTGPFTLLSFLDVYYQGGAFKYSCGHKAARNSIFRPPKVLQKALDNRGLLATLINYDDVVLFDPERMKGRVSGHREKKLCPHCFFEKLLNQLDPTCPFCRKRMHHKDSVWLVRHSVLNLRQRRLIKPLKVKHEDVTWAVCCCSTAEVSDVFQEDFTWDSKSRSIVTA
jgi:hypothetical protein